MSTFNRRVVPALMVSVAKVEPLPAVSNVQRAESSRRDFILKTLDTVQVNPVLEQPRLIFNSLAQPIIRWGYRKFTRTQMRATPPFQGRWMYAGFILNPLNARPTMRGVPTRAAGGGYSYSYPAYGTSPRSVRLRGMRPRPGER